MKTIKYPLVLVVLALVFIAPRVWAAETPVISLSSWSLTETGAGHSQTSGGDWSRVESWLASGGTPKTTSTYDGGTSHQTNYGCGNWKISSQVHCALIPVQGRFGTMPLCSTRTPIVLTMVIMSQDVFGKNRACQPRIKSSTVGLVLMLELLQARRN